MSKLPVLRGGIPKPTSINSGVQPAAKRARLDVKGPADTSSKSQSGLISNPNSTSKRLFTGAKRSTAPVPTTRQPLKRAASSASNVRSNASKPAGKKSTAVVKSSSLTKASSAPPKRAAWDVKGQLEDMKESMKKMQEQVEQLQVDKENQVEHLTTTKTEELCIIDKNHRHEVENLKENTERIRREMQICLEDVNNEKELFRKENASLLIERNALSDRNDELEAAVRLGKKEQAAMRLTEREMKLDMQQLEQSNKQLKGTVVNLTEELRLAHEKISNMEDTQRQHETERRKLHNAVQELKGNIRVYCRVRPPLTVAENNASIFAYPDLDYKKVILSRPNSLNESCLNETMRKTEMEFTFDHIFTPASTQAEVFEEISQLVQSALDGYNVCIFAYGQTGSGKTYTMQGGEKMTDQSQGMIPRSIEKVFTSTAHLSQKGWEYRMDASFLEIYNESIRDLLAEPGSEQKHEIKTASGEVIVTNLTIVTVKSPAQIENLFERSTKNRAVAETSCNSRSSRSHSVFTLKIFAKNSVTSEQCVGTLNLVDLAGSERLKDSKSAGDRLTETKSINSSLAALGNVIMSLSAKKSHIPYRDSRLTFLLQNSLGGNSKTLMFVNVSPSEDNYNETVNSMRFATKVNNCSIGTAKKSNK